MTYLGGSWPGLGVELVVAQESVALSWSSHTPRTNSRSRSGGRGDRAGNLAKSVFGRIQEDLYEACGADVFYFVSKANHS